MFEEKNVENVRTVEACGNQNDVEFEKSPLKLLIDKYESMNGQNESDMTCAKPRCTTSNRPKCVMPVRTGARPAEVGARPGQTVGMIKKKVWGVKKNGLDGWKVVVVNKQPSTNIHT